MLHDRIMQIIAFERSEKDKLTDFYINESKNSAELQLYERPIPIYYDLKFIAGGNGNNYGDEFLSFIVFKPTLRWPTWISY